MDAPSLSCVLLALQLLQYLTVTCTGGADALQQATTFCCFNNWGRQPPTIAPYKPATPLCRPYLSEPVYIYIRVRHAHALAETAVVGPLQLVCDRLFASLHRWPPSPSAKQVQQMLHSCTPTATPTHAPVKAHNVHTLQQALPLLHTPPTAQRKAPISALCWRTHVTAVISGQASGQQLVSSSCTCEYEDTKVAILGP